MSKPPLRSVLPLPRVRPRAWTQYGSSSHTFSTLYHSHFDPSGPVITPPHPSGRPGSGIGVTPRLQPATGQQNGTSGQTGPPTSGDSFLQLQLDAPGVQNPGYQYGQGTSPTSPIQVPSQPFPPASQQLTTHPPPPPTPPLQNSVIFNPLPRSLPLPPPNSNLSTIGAFPPLSYYQHILGSIPSSQASPSPAKKPRSAFSLESAAYGIPKQRQRSLSPAPGASSSSFVASTMPSALPYQPSTVHPRPTDESLHLAAQVGEDAYFLLPNALGVSDGVGGWAHRPRTRASGSPSPSVTPGGISPSALFSRRLMHFCADEISVLDPLPESWPAPAGMLPSPSPTHHTQPAGSSGSPLAPSTSGSTFDALDAFDACPWEPKAVLDRAYNRAVTLARADHTVTGSSTALIAILIGDELRVAHLGDCALCLVRGGEIVYRSEEMQWKFNHPLQLGPSSSTLPSDAQRIVLPVQPDDILILASDGMSDNLWDEDVLDEVLKFTNSSSSPSPVPSYLGPTASTIRRHALPVLLSEALCSRAKRASQVGPSQSRPHPISSDGGVTNGAGGVVVGDEGDASEFVPDIDGEVPFARRAREEGIKFSGGKCDDISVLVAVISAEGSAKDDSSSVSMNPQAGNHTGGSAPSLSAFAGDTTSVPRSSKTSNLNMNFTLLSSRGSH